MGFDDIILWGGWDDEYTDDADDAAEVGGDPFADGDAAEEEEGKGGK